MSARYWYRAFGLLIRSDLSLPEYRESQPGHADIVIRCGAAARDLRKRIERSVDDIRGAHLTDHGMLMHVERVGDFIIRDGREIDVSPLPDVEMNLLRLYLVGSVIGSLFHQRRQFVFHGAAVLSPKGVSIFVGPSGAGKSTLTAHLAKAGYPAFADDTLPLFEADQQIVVWPGAQVFKMWEDALQGIDQRTDPLPHVSKRYGKFFLDNPLPAPDQPERVAQVFVLERGEGFSIDRLSGLEVISALNDNTYRREIIGFLGHDASYLAQLGALAEKLEFYRFTRPDDASRLPEAVEHLVAHWAGSK